MGTIVTLAPLGRGHRLCVLSAGGGVGRKELTIKMGFGRPAEVIQTQREYLVEAAGVELSSMLTARKLLILGTATTAKKARLPDPLYVYCTKMLLLWSSADTTHWPQHPIDSSGWIEKNT